MLQLRQPRQFHWSHGAQYCHPMRAGLNKHAACTDALSVLLATLLPMYKASQLFGQDPLLAVSLSELLIPSLAVAAVALQLPPERRPPGCTWRSTVHSASALFVIGLFARDSLATRLSSGSGPLARLLPAAVQLVQHVPLPADAAGLAAPDERLQWEEVVSLAQIVSLAAQVHFQALQNQRQLGSSGRAALERQVAQTELLLPLIPRLAVILKAFAEDAQARVWPSGSPPACMSPRT